MKTGTRPLSRLPLVTCTLIWYCLNLHAQSGPTITSQPASQTVFAGTNVAFSVAVDGTGPFIYQWQINGTNFPTIITSVAGTGSAMFAGDGGAATNASLSAPHGVALDVNGSLYIADTSHYRIRKVDTNGIITTVAGNGLGAYAGDGGPATNASLSNPFGVAVDSLGNLYVSDWGNNRVRKVDTNGIITTVVGDGIPVYSGDGGAATNASLGLPAGMTFDSSGNLYIAAQQNNRICKVDTNGIITTVAGSGNAGYSGDGGAATDANLYVPEAVALDASGNLYIADSDNERIRKVDTNGIITTLAGNGIEAYAGDGGAATNASLAYPLGLVSDAFGNLYIADNHNQRIRLADTNGVITTVAGGGSHGYSGDGGAATNADLSYPAGLALDASGNLYIADWNNNRIREVHFAGHPTFTLTNVTTNNNAGNYAVVVTSPYGSVTSAVATLTVHVPLLITVQPASERTLVGSDMTLSVTATGDPPLYYSWYFDATNLVQSGTNASFVVTNISSANAGSYTVVVTNAYASLTSQVATLTLLYPPSVITPPASQRVLPGANTSLSVTAGGTGPFSYQWQFNGNNLATNVITTVAGNGAGAYAGDGGVATSASLYSPKGVALDAGGNLYIADTTNNRIRMVGIDGIINTMAGNGSGGYSGDGGAATNAGLYYPYGVVLDASGNLYIADQNNNRIRLVGTNGIITTVAGNGGAAYYGDGKAATNAMISRPRGVALDAAGNLYIADQSNNRVRMVGTNGIITTVAGNGAPAFAGDGGAATNASLRSPSGVALDALGNLYIADTVNSRIRKVATNGIITTIAGNGSGTYAGDGGAATNTGLGGPIGVALDDLGNLYITDTTNNCIRMVASNGTITTVAGNGNGTYQGDGGPANKASLNGPSGVALDGFGSLYIADSANNRIRKVPTRGYPTLALADVSANNAGDYSVIISSPYGNVTSVVATLTVEAPPVITVQPAKQVAAPGSSPVFSTAVAGSGPFEYLWYFAGTNLLQSGASSMLTLPSVSTNDAGNYMVVVTNAYGSVTSQVATLAVAYPPSVTIQPSQTNTVGTGVTLSVALDGPGPFTYQWRFNGTNLPNNIISTVAGSASQIPPFAGDGGPATNAHLNIPSGVTLDAVGNLYLADSMNNRVRKVDKNGIITTIAGNGSLTYSGDGGPATSASLRYPNGAALDASGNLYIADSTHAVVRKVDTNGIITTVAGNGSPGYSGDGGAATNANLNSPNGVALDAFGNLYIADASNNRMRKVDTSGIITTVAGKNAGGYSGDGGTATNASLNVPYCVAFDALGNLYIADHNNNRIRMVGTYDIITTVAGKTSALGYSGDGGPATDAALHGPFGVTLDAVGNLYLADALNNRVRMVDTNGIITTVAGNGGPGYSGDGGTATNAVLHGPTGVALDVSGNLYIADGGNNRIRKVHFAGDPALTLASVDFTNAGNYTVVVTSPYGSMTSAVAVLTVTLPRTPPQIITGDASFGVQSNQFGFNVRGTVGQTIIVDGSTNLVDWLPLNTSILSGSLIYFSDPAWTNFTSRYYRARLP